MKCNYCNKIIYMDLNGFSGLKQKKFCSGCWSKIYTVYSGLQMIEQEPNILNLVLKIK